jgi:hypothetical protein
MMQILGGVLSLLAGLGLIVVYAHELGRKRGEKKGFDRGFKAAEQWIVELESGVEKERQKIWREEG